jgi:oxygen-independent coproporphyrinogen-3 oxidase
VLQVAALFAMSNRPDWVGEIAQLPDDTMLIYHHFLRENFGQSSICEIFYQTGSGLRYIARREYSSDCDGLRQQRWLVRLNLYYLLCGISGENPSPWGTLSGVRPTKIVHRLLDRCISPQTVAQMLTQ